MIQHSNSLYMVTSVKLTAKALDNSWTYTGNAEYRHRSRSSSSCLAVHKLQWIEDSCARIQYGSRCQTVPQEICKSTTGITVPYVYLSNAITTANFVNFIWIMRTALLTRNFRVFMDSIGDWELSQASSEHKRLNTHTTCNSSLTLPSNPSKAISSITALT